MTSTEGRKTVRLTSAQVRSGGRSKQVVVFLSGSDIALRLKGERKVFRMPAAMAYSLAVQMWVVSEKARKKALRAERKKLRGY